MGLSELLEAVRATPDAAPMRRRAGASLTRFANARRIGLLAVFLFASLFYAWTAASAGDRAEFFAYPDYYAQLSEGFLHGELSIPTPAPKGLVDLANPYNPVANAKYRVNFGDLALYHGHLYLDWGPTPAITLYLPWHLLHLGTLSGNLAIWIYSVVGLAAALALLYALVEAFLPKARAIWVVLIGAAVAFGNGVPFIDREPDIYEVAVAAGYCFSMLGCYLLATGCLLGRWRPKRLALGSFCLGLAVAARQDLLVLGLLLAGALVFAWRKRHAGEQGSLGTPLRAAMILLAPFVAVAALLAIYDFARFGSFTQIGASYQLAGFNPRSTPYYQLSYLAPSWYFYLVSPLHWSLTFPFISIPQPIAPIGVPPAYAPEIIGGIFSQSPILLSLLAAPLALRRRLPSALRTAMWLSLTTGFVIVTAIALSIPGGSERYVVDFATLFLIPAGLCWLAWTPRRRLWRIVVRGAGTLLICYGVVAGIAVSITGYYDQITFTQPGLYQDLTSATNGVGDLITSLLGHPVLTAIDTSAGITDQTSWDSFGVGDVIYMNISGNPANLEVVSPGRGTYDLTMSVGPGPQYSAAGNSPIYLEVRDASGTYRFRYHNGTVNLPLRLRGGDNHALLSVVVPGRNLPSSDSILSCSGLRLDNAKGSPRPFYSH